MSEYWGSQSRYCPAIQFRTLITQLPPNLRIMYRAPWCCCDPGSCDRNSLGLSVRAASSVLTGLVASQPPQELCRLRAENSGGFFEIVWILVSPSSGAWDVEMKSPIHLSVILIVKQIELPKVKFTDKKYFN